MRLIGAVLVLGSAGVSWGQYWTVNDPTVCGTQDLGNFNGVTACSNAGASGKQNQQTLIDTGMEWECVEYVNRFYYLYYGLNLKSIWTGNANQWWAQAPSSLGLTPYANGGPTPPKIGDIITSSYTNSSTNPPALGHVAIVRSVTSNSVCTSQQNWSNNTGDVNGTRCTTLTESNNTFTLGPLYSSGSPYTADGWLRRACGSNSSQVFSVQAHPEGTIVTTDGRTYYLLYSGAPGAAITKVGIANPDAFRNPYNQAYYDNEFGFDEAVTISAGELSQYPSAGFDLSSARYLPANGWNNPDGKLISNASTIAIVSNGQKRQFTSASDFLTLGYKLCNVILDGSYANYPVGPNIVVPGPSTAPTVTTGTATSGDQYQRDAERHGESQRRRHEVLVSLWNE
jgi:hypothetical protein